MPRHTIPAILAIALLATPLTSGTAQAAAQTMLLRDAVASLPTGTESRDGYERSSFRHWIDADRDGCNTRYEVLIEEAVTPPEVGSRCALVGGQWHSYYDDITVEQASELDVDHVVPLAEAWDSGAHAWSPAQRQTYANDLSDPNHLVAVTARSNRQKADQDPSTWLPIEPVRCRYIGEWTAIKLRWELTVDNVEKDTLTSLAAECPNEPIEIPPLP
ncbi:HNH endonuclease family protein [Nonomuraea sp. NPDC023979]|uniref:HNH endonuclease family protein n=1 Tax=Nonomuraea sp. NPDC023979 TaxID=3154796 RepID=UPI0033FD2058